jgi:hypothetical protein
MRQRPPFDGDLADHFVGFVFVGAHIDDTDAPTSASASAMARRYCSRRR